jgi:cytochrome c2
MPGLRPSSSRIAQILAGLLLLGPPMLGVAACDDHSEAAVPVSGADPRRGAALIAQLGCGSCHSVPGVSGAAGRVGPPLDNIGDRTIIAGVLPNTPDNLITWLMTPQSVVPGNAMPNMELNNHDARDVAAYLYTLR